MRSRPKVPKLKQNVKFNRRRILMRSTIILEISASSVTRLFQRRLRDGNCSAIWAVSQNKAGWRGKWFETEPNSLAIKLAIHLYSIDSNGPPFEYYTGYISCASRSKSFESNKKYYWGNRPVHIYNKARSTLARQTRK